MELVQVDVVGLQSMEAVLDRPADVPPGAASDTGALAHVPAPLGSENHLVPPALQHLAQDGLGPPAVAVDVGRVEQCDPGVDGRVDDLPRLLEPDPHPEVVAPETDDRHGETRFPQLAVAHGASLSRPPA